MTIGDRIPDLSDQELERLHSNALRLKDTGSIVQQRQAEELLPLLSAAIEKRRAARVAALAGARRVSAERKRVAGKGVKVKSK